MPSGVARDRGSKRGFDEIGARFFSGVESSKEVMLRKSLKLGLGWS